jgi:hypothetical protein
MSRARNMDSNSHYPDSLIARSVFVAEFFKSIGQPETMHLGLL